MSTRFTAPLAIVIPLIVIGLTGAHTAAQNPFSLEQLKGSSSTSHNHARTASPTAPAASTSQQNVFSLEQIRTARVSRTRSALSGKESQTWVAPTGSSRSVTTPSGLNSAASRSGASGAATSSPASKASPAPVLIANSWGGRSLRMATRTPTASVPSAAAATPGTDANRASASPATQDPGNATDTDRNREGRNRGNNAGQGRTARTRLIQGNPVPAAGIASGINAWDTDYWPRFRVAIYRGNLWNPAYRYSNRLSPGIEGRNDRSGSRGDTPQNVYDIRNWYPWFGRTES